MSALIALLKEHRKAFGAALLAGLTWGHLVVNSHPSTITADEWLVLGSMLLASFGIGVAQNQTPGGGR